MGAFVGLVVLSVGLKLGAELSSILVGEKLGEREDLDGVLVGPVE